MARRRRVEVVKRNEGAGDVLDLWVEAAIGDGWTAAFRVFEQGGSLIVGELRIYPEEPDEGNPDSSAYGPYGERRAGEWSAAKLGDKARGQIPAGGLTARKARDVRFDAVREAVRELLAKARIEQGVDVDELFQPGGLLARQRIEPELLQQDRSRRRQTHDDHFLSQIAAIYVDLVRDSREPAWETARTIGYSLAHTKRLLTEARRRGLLTGTTRRRAGGELTEKARALLARKEDA
jgi:hypothetical protein